MLENVQSYTEELPEFRYPASCKGGAYRICSDFWQYNTTPRDKLIMDMMYIEQFSILRDIQLILADRGCTSEIRQYEAFGKKKKSDMFLFPLNNRRKSEIQNGCKSEKKDTIGGKRKRETGLPA